MKELVQIAIFASGCFWCTEAVFQRLRGVMSVLPGYAGGSQDTATYEEVSTGATGHAESAKIEFDPAQISFRDLLEVFFATHDPTTLNRQGNDVGTQYRSAIFYVDDEQRQAAEAIIKELTDEKAFQNPIVTEVRPLDKFYPAENYHRDYYNNNTNQPYCQFVIAPKLKKFKEKFASLVKDEIPD
jgi:peptide-methionine (S)-S-oxide reductase